MTTLKEYWQRLKDHDWYFEQSDDHNVWQRGRTERDKLLMLSKQTPSHAQMYSDFAKHYMGLIVQRSIPKLPRKPTRRKHV